MFNVIVIIYYPSKIVIDESASLGVVALLILAYTYTFYTRLCSRY
jgi:hypothetical protein